MTIQITVGETVNMSAYFLDYNDITDDEVVFDPDSVAGNIYLYNSVTSEYDAFDTFTPSEAVSGYFTYDWTTSLAGKFQIDFVASISGQSDVTNTRFLFVGDISTTDTLDADAKYYYLGQLDPLYLDPEIILTYYSEADLIEVTELIHWYSKELLYLLNAATIPEITTLMQDYILASVLCDLSKIYTFSGGLSGFTASDSFTLGDLQVKSDAGASGYGSGSNRGNVSTWCELAALLRSELIGTKNNLKAIVTGCNYTNPIPERALKRVD